MADIQQQLQQKPEGTANDSPSVFERDLEEFVLEHYDECMLFNSCSSPGTTVMEGEEGDRELLSRRRTRPNLDSDAWAESSVSKRHHSRVLRRWAAQQVEMITIERRNRESELRALAGLHTVSMLDASFLRESHSPSMRHHGNMDKPTTQTSSILQMWLELEDENALHQAREKSRQRRSVESNANASLHAFESEEGENQDRAGEATESDYAILSHDHQLGPQTVRDHGNFSCEQSPDLGEVERERVRHIGHGWMESVINDQISKVMQSNKTPRAECLGVTEHERLRIVREGMQMKSHQRLSHGKEQNNEPGCQSDHALEGPVTEHEDSQAEHIRRDMLRLRGRQALLDLLVRFKRDRQRELQVLREQCSVSDFAHRYRIQSLLRSRFLRNERPAEEERPPSVAANELRQLRQKHTVSGLREGFRSRLENIVHVQLNSHSETPSDNDNSDSQYDHNNIANESLEIRHEFWNIDEVVGISDRSAAVPSTSHHGAPVQGSDQQREVIEGERPAEQLSVHDNSNEWIYNTTEDSDRNQPENPVPNWPSETTVTEDEHRLQEVHEIWHDNGSQATEDNWSGGPLDPPRMQRSVSNRLTRFHPPDDDNVYNMELRELLNRRSVSNLLCSGFRESLDQLVQSYVERQGMPPIDSDTQRNLPVPSSPERDQDLQNDDQNEDHLHAVGRSSLTLPTRPVPPTRPLWRQELHHSGWSGHGVNLSGFEMINDLRLDMAKLQEVMNLMQRLLEDCMGLQQELQRSVRQELSAALNWSTGGQGLANTSVRGSKWGQVRKGTCCICCDNQIDCLLYRCGHMCTCSKCGNELILGGEKCPLCQAPIVEVVRAYCIL